MQKIKLTKHELKRHKESLRRYNRFLPTLVAKKQQLQREIVRVKGEIAKLKSTEEKVREGMRPWAKLLAEDVGLDGMITLKGIRRKSDNVAGVDIPLFGGADIEVAEYDLLTTPLWVDSAVEAIVKLMELGAEQGILGEQLKLLSEELVITTQRVNLFEKVKIPEAIEAIRRITIHLGDQQTAAVVWAKMAKRKMEARTL
ncbi:MAG: V-type ATP synthase subunit D [bacterium]|nr:V-type ATP synthase subunit D [bacterium]